MKRRLIKFANRFYFYKILANKKHIYDIKTNPEKEANRVYWPFFKKEIDFDNPKNLVEKMYWLLFNTDTSLWSRCEDKLAVRDYVKEVDPNILQAELLGAWNHADEIDFGKLPNSFIFKTNNGSGTNILIKDKSSINIRSIRKQLNRFLRIKYGYASALFHYAKIEPKIIAESLLIQDNEEKRISPNSLMDYKVFCINGEPELIWMNFDRKKDAEYITAYDLNWNKFHDHLLETDRYKISNVDIPKPKCLEQMLEYCRKLSKPFHQVRVDFYIVDNKPVFGELSFASSWGFLTHEYYDYLGSKIDLNDKERV